MEKEIKINKRSVGLNHRPYIIAEACINHQGELGLAKEMVLIAKTAGADAIKFQYHVLDDEMLKNSPQSKNFEKGLYETLLETNLSFEAHLELKTLCEQVGIQYLCTPFSRKAVDALLKLGVSALKVGSGEMTNIPMQKHIANTGLPTIFSTGMSEQDEISETATVYNNAKVDYAIMHCVSAYPCPYEISNLDNITALRKKFRVPIGLSDHTKGIYTSIGAVTLGASIIEKHFTLDRSMPGPDHESSLEPMELNELVRGCHAVFLARGCKKTIFPQEKEILEWARESVVSIQKINEGDELSTANISVKRPAPSEGIVPAKDFELALGMVASVDIEAHTQIRWSQLAEK